MDRWSREPRVPQVPAYVLTNSLLTLLGRRRTLAGFMLVGGAACLAIQVLRLAPSVTWPLASPGPWHHLAPGLP